MYIKVLLLAFVLIPTKTSSTYCSYHSTQIIRIIPQQIHHITLLNELVDIQYIHVKPWIKPSLPFVPVLFSARTETAQFVLEFCKKHNMPAEIVISDLQQGVIQIPKPSTSSTKTFFSLEMHPSAFKLNEYHNWQEIDAFMHKLQQTYERSHPGLCTVIEVGRSFENRPMKALKISSPGRNVKKGIWIDAAIHAREWISSSIATYIAYQLTVGYNKSEEIKNLVNDVTWYILPVFNVDGYVYSWETDRMWRKSRSTASRCTKAVRQTDPTCICQGVDLNRNFKSAWNTSDACTHPCCNTYPGPEPMSEKEVQNVANFLTQNQDKIQAYIALHNYGQMWQYPYGFDEKKVVRGAHIMHEIGELAVQAIRNVHGSNYSLGTAPKTAYKFSGSSADWVIDNTNLSLAFLIETRPTVGGDFCLDESEILPTSEEVFEGIKVVARALAGKANLTGMYGKHFHTLALRSSTKHYVNYVLIIMLSFLKLIF